MTVGSGAASDAVPAIVGLILAGGRSSRMGRDKALIPLGGTALVQRTVDRLRPQVAALAISANGDPRLFDFLGLPVLPDATPGAGPMSGLAAGLRWANGIEGAAHLALVPCDTPFFPRDLVRRLAGAAIGDADRIAVPRSGGRSHPVFGLFPTSCTEPLARWLAEGQKPTMQRWIETRPHLYVDVEDDPDPFFNINTPEDLALAAQYLAQGETR